MSPRVTAGVIVAIALSPSVNAQARPCPRATLVGDDGELVAQIERRLGDPTMATTTSTAACERLVVDVRRVGTSVHLATRDGRRTRTVDSTDTAATLVASWTAPALDGLEWADPPPPPAVVAPTAPPPPPPAPVADVAAPVEVAAPAENAWPLRYWIAGGASASEGAGYGGGTEIGVELGRRWTLAPVARLLVDSQPTSDANAGSDNVEIALGGQAGWATAFGAVRVQPRFGLFATFRYVNPTAPVGALACAPAQPCTIGDTVPGVASAYSALTMWGEASVAADWYLTPEAAAGLVLAVAVTPGHATVDAPIVGDTPGAIVRDLPVHPRWRASLAVGVRFGGAP